MIKWQAILRPNIIILIAIIIVALAAGLVWLYQKSTNQGDGVLPNVSNVIGQLPSHSIDHPAIKLADTNQPAPTNSWLSGLVFDSKDAAVYMYPWTYQSSDTGATLSYPDISSSPTAVTASHTPDLTIDFTSDDYRVESYDDLSAEVAYQSQGQTVATARLVQGSPYIYINLKPDQKLDLKAQGSFSDEQQGYSAKVGDKHYGVWIDKQLEASVQGDTLAITAGGSGGQLTLIALPDSVNDAVAFGLAGHQVTGTKVSYQTDNSSTTTTYQLETADDKSTLFGLLPYQTDSKSEGRAGTIDTLAGKQTLKTGTKFSYKLDQPVPDSTIITGQLSAKQRDQLATQLKQDIDATQFDATDSYGAGKQLYRAANLLQLAYELDQPDAGKKIHDKLSHELALWLDPNGSTERDNKYFYYDSDIRGLVGVEPSFGSDQFNDHQFHYGYFIYAASIVAHYDQDFANKHRQMVSALIRDVASPSATKHFPKLRTYDSYVGHSWADGYGDTIDGNNQESSSEAVNSAYAIYLWGQATSNKKLQDFGQWLYQNQATTALNKWVNIDKQAVPFNNYQPPIASLVWQGKREYGTFFSDEPSAKLGIQLIPMSPGQIYLAKDKSRIEANLKSVDQPNALGDYLLMYRALAQPDKARQAIDQLEPADIDSANSLSYIMAWVYSTS